MNWKREISKCFGPEDLVFAGTPAEARHANELRSALRKADVPPCLIVAEIEDWLHQETSNTGQLFEQMKRVRSFFEA